MNPLGCTLRADSAFRQVQETYSAFSEKKPMTSDNVAAIERVAPIRGMKDEQQKINYIQGTFRKAGEMAEGFFASKLANGKSVSETLKEQLGLDGEGIESLKKSYAGAIATAIFIQGEGIGSVTAAGVNSKMSGLLGAGKLEEFKQALSSGEEFAKLLEPSTTYGSKTYSNRYVSFVMAHQFQNQAIFNFTQYQQQTREKEENAQSRQLVEQWQKVITASGQYEIVKQNVAGAEGTASQSDYVSDGNGGFSLYFKDANNGKQYSFDVVPKDGGAGPMGFSITAMHMINGAMEKDEGSIWGTNVSDFTLDMSKPGSLAFATKDGHVLELSPDQSKNIAAGVTYSYDAPGSKLAVSNGNAFDVEAGTAQVQLVVGQEGDKDGVSAYVMGKDLYVKKGDGEPKDIISLVPGTYIAEVSGDTLTLSSDEAAQISISLKDGKLSISDSELVIIAGARVPNIGGRFLGLAVPNESVGRDSFGTPHEIVGTNPLTNRPIMGRELEFRDGNYYYKQQPAGREQPGLQNIVETQSQQPRDVQSQQPRDVQNQQQGETIVQEQQPVQQQAQAPVTDPALFQEEIDKTSLKDKVSFVPESNSFVVSSLTANGEPLEISGAPDWKPELQLSAGTDGSASMQVTWRDAQGQVVRLELAPAGAESQPVQYANAIDKVSVSNSGVVAVDSFAAGSDGKYSEAHYPSS